MKFKLPKPKYLIGDTVVIETEKKLFRVLQIADMLYRKGRGCRIWEYWFEYEGRYVGYKREDEILRKLK